MNDWNCCGANVRGRVLCLAVLSVLPMVCKVCPLSVCDKSDVGRPQHSGCGPRDKQEYFTVSWDKEGLIIFVVRYESIPLPLAESYTGTAGIISDLYLLPSQCVEASQDRAGLWSFAWTGWGCVSEISYVVRPFRGNEPAWLECHGCRGIPLLPSYVEPTVNTL